MQNLHVITHRPGLTSWLTFPRILRSRSGDRMIALGLSIYRQLSGKFYLLFCFSIVAFAQSRRPNAVGEVATIRGVNLGGWFVTEPCK